MNMCDKLIGWNIFQGSLRPVHNRNVNIKSLYELQRWLLNTYTLFVCV